LIKNILTMLSGSSIATLIPILASPFLTRIYSTSEFGVGELYLILTTLLALIITYRLELSFVLPKSEEKAKSLYSSVINLAFFQSLALYIPILIIIYVFDVKYSNVYLLLPLSVLSVAIYESSLYFNIRHNSYKTVGLLKVCYFSTIVALKITLGILGFSYWGTILGTVLGQMTGAIIAFTYNYKRYSFYSISSFSELREIITEYSEFPKFNLPQTLLNFGKEYSLSFIIVTLWNPHFVGLYSLALKILKSPIYLVGNAIGDVFYKKLSNDSNNLELNFKQELRSFFYLILLSFPFYYLFIFYSEQIISLIFGVKWQESAQYIKVLSPWFYLIFLSISVERIAIVLKKQKELLKLNLIFDLSNIGVFIFIAGYSKDLKYSLAVISAIGACSKVITNTYIFISFKNFVTSQKKHL